MHRGHPRRRDLAGLDGLTVLAAVELGIHRKSSEGIRAAVILAGLAAVDALAAPVAHLAAVVLARAR